MQRSEKPKTQRTMYLIDENYAVLKALVLYRQLRGEQSTISGIVEECITEYLENHKLEVENAKSFKTGSPLQMTLFDGAKSGNNS